MVTKKVIKLSDLESHKILKKNIDVKTSSLQFLPKALFEISKEKYFYYKGKKLKTSYLIDITHNLILKYYFRKENKFHLLATILKEKYGYNYNYYMDYLLENKILVLLSNYKKGYNAKIYAIYEPILNNEIIRYNNNDNTLLKKYKSKILDLREDNIEDEQIASDIKLKLVNDLFKVDIQLDRAIFFLDSLKDDDLDVYNKNRYSVESIQDKHIFYHFDAYGRMHTNFTILKSFIRKNCLLIDGCETLEIDISNSQPLFLTKLIKDSGTKWVDKTEYDLLYNLTFNGVFYDYIMNHIGTKDRSSIKNLTYKVLFGRNNSKADKIFQELFPTTYNYIKLYKKECGDYKALAYSLQRAESDLLFNSVIKRIMDVADIPMITIHDSIVYPKQYKEIVEKIFNEELKKAFQ